jgi:hypothetical protein
MTHHRWPFRLMATGRSQLPLGSAGDPSSGDGGRAGLAVSTAQTAAARRRRAARLDRANGYPLPRIRVLTQTNVQAITTQVGHPALS